MKALWDETNIIIFVSVVAESNAAHHYLKLTRLASVNDILSVKKEVVRRLGSVRFSTGRC